MTIIFLLECKLSMCQGIILFRFSGPIHLQVNSENKFYERSSKAVKHLAESPTNGIRVAQVKIMLLSPRLHVNIKSRETEYVVVLFTG